MKTKILFIALLVSLAMLPCMAVQAQTGEPLLFEFDDAGAPPTTTSTSAPDPSVPDPSAAWIVCKIGHWISGPLTCVLQHIDDVTVLAYCGNIKIGGVWYHIHK